LFFPAVADEVEPDAPLGFFDLQPSLPRRTANAAEAACTTAEAVLDEMAFPPPPLRMEAVTI
jgi:hypothetical protein